MPHRIRHYNEVCLAYNVAYNFTQALERGGEAQMHGLFISHNIITIVVNIHN